MAIGTTAAILGATALSTAGGLVANNQANKAAQAAANAAQIDPVEQARQSLDLQIQYAPQLLALEQQLQPGYADLANTTLSRQLFGQGTQFDSGAAWNALTDAQRADYTRAGADQGISGTEWWKRTIQEQAQQGDPQKQALLSQFTRTDPNSLLGIYEQAQPALSNLQATTNTAARQADIADVTNLGGQAVAAYRNANPELTSATNSLSANIAADRAAGGPSVANGQLASGSPLMGTLEADAAAKLNSRTALQAELERQAMAELGTGGRLSAQGTRDAEQAVRAAAADRGMVMSNSTIFNEALNKESLVRQRQAEARALGLTVDAAGVNQDTNNRNYALGVASQGNQLSTFNADLSRALNNDQYGREFALTQMLQSQSVDPYSLVLGRGNATPMAFNAAGQAGAMQTGPQYSTLFDPTVSSIANNNANANAAAGNARANNWGAMAGSIFGGGFGLAGDILGGG